MRRSSSEPQAYVDDAHFGDFAKDVIEDRRFVRPEPISYRTWGAEGIEAGSHDQMRKACSLPHAAGAALMPDAHVGYGLPIGGVLALENAVCPYAVGVDIACRMKLSVLDLPADSLDDQEMFHVFKGALEQGTVFGTGKSHAKRQQHDVMDRDWTITKTTRENKDKAWNQLGTSGSGNHFVEFGRLTLDEPELGLEAGEYVALMSHSGSRGPGHAVCSTYSSIAQHALPKKFDDLRHLAWLDLDSEAGQEYWAAMNLMGDYAAANHDVIHRLVSSLCGAAIIAGVENHHNFAWKETHGGREVIVHRKGATPAGKGVLGVIPGSMASPAYVVRGIGESRLAGVGVSWCRPRDVAQEGEGEVQLQGGQERPAEEGRAYPLGRCGRSAGRLQEHRRRDARAVGPGGDDRAVRSEDRQDVRRRQPRRRLTRLDDSSEW